jgi:hypothetical protein
MHDIIVNDGANSATTILAARPRIYDMPTICEHRDATRSGSVCSRLAMLCTPHAQRSCAAYDVVDRDKDQLHEKADEAHDREANRSRLCNLRELCDTRATGGVSSGSRKEKEPASISPLTAAEQAKPSWSLLLHPCIANAGRVGRCAAAAAADDGQLSLAARWLFAASLPACWLLL